MNLLMVDDDRISIDILAEYIKPQLEYIHKISCAYDGEQAFDIIISLKPEIIITDIRMPKMSGMELIKKVRSIDGYEPYVIIISSYSDFEYAREALQLDVFDYIVKPIDQNELIDKVNACVKSNDMMNAETYEDIFDQIQKFISNHLDDSIKLVDISKRYHYNAAYLGRLIKERTGSSYNDYLLKLRVIKAQSLLSNSNLSISEISTKVGYKDPEYFSRRFKKVTGTTPSNYRKKQL